MSHPWKISRQCLLVASAYLLLSACTLGGSQYRSSNVVSYLYPNQQQPVADAGQHARVMPVRVGVAFVPEQGLSIQALTEADKQGLKTTVTAYFEQQPFVSGVTLVPSAYLAPGGSFGNLDQLGKMYDIDVMVLLSYDRTQFAGVGPSEVNYWTLDGARLVSGERNDTHTLLDVAVYDIGDRQLLFHASGASLIHYQPGGMSLAEQLRQDSLAGFEQAGAELMMHLRQQLELFAVSPLTVGKQAGATGAR